MPTHRHPPELSAAIDAAAAAWLARRDRGFTELDAAEFALWRSADLRHEAAVARLEAAWNALDRLRDFRPEGQAHPDSDLLVHARRARVIPFPQLAAAALVACAAVWMFLLWSPAQPPLAPTPSSGQVIVHPGPELLTLDDGSVVELKKNAHVEAHFTPTERRVVLTQGEALFRVAKNPARPFIVEAGQVSVRAVGTAFNVKLAQASIAVLVTEGRVRLDRAAASPEVPVTDHPQLVAGQRAVITTQPTEGAPAGSVAINELTPGEMEQALAWQRTRLEFIDLPLAQVVAEFNRYNHQKLVVEDAATAAVLVGGNFRADNVEAFVRLLDPSFGVTATERDGQIVLRKKR